jgi:hypothetical protein
MEYFLSMTHWLDALTPPLERHLARLVETVRALIEVGAEEKPDPVVPASASDVRAPRGHSISRLFHKIWIGLLLAAVLVFASVLLYVAGVFLAKEPANRGPVPGSTDTALESAFPAVHPEPSPSEGAEQSSATVAGTTIPTPAIPTPTSLQAAIPILSQFDAPGTPRSIAWDGSALWIASGDFAEEVTLMKMDGEGNTKEVYLLDDRSVILPPYGFEYDVGMTWVESVLWLAVCNPVRGYRFSGGGMEEVSRFAGLGQDVNCVYGGNPVAWDGEGFWLTRADEIQRKSADGAVLENFRYGFGIRAVGWDGEFLWAATGMFARHGGRTLDVVDPRGGSLPLASFPMPAGMGEFITGLAWDGEYLWALSGTRIFRLDIRNAKESAAQAYLSISETRALHEVLRPDSNVDGGRVNVVNHTPSVLKITFENFNYTVEIPPQSSQSVTPPESEFLAEATGVPSIRGSYLSLGGCNWIFEIVGPENLKIENGRSDTTTWNGKVLRAGR